MAAGGRKGGSDFVLESRHVVGLFLLLVVIFGMVFTLGYMLGRSQFDSKLRAATASADGDLPAIRKTSTKSEAAKLETPPAAPAAQPAATPEWDFYRSSDPGPKDAPAVPATPAATPKAFAPAAPRAAGAAARAPKSAPPLNAPLIPEGTIMLQVAAVTSQTDALSLAQALQQKKFPAFVIPPATDKYYRVQVGPYKNAQAAAAGRNDLEAQGFKTIAKR